MGGLGRTKLEVKLAKEIRACCVHLHCNSFHTAGGTSHLEMSRVELFDRDNKNMD